LTEGQDRGSRRFRPPLLPTLLAMVMLGILLALGTWQTGRYQEATQLVEDYKERHDETPALTSFEGFSGADRLEQLQYRRVELKGTLVTEEAQVLTAIYKFAMPGYGVLMPLKLESPGRYQKILVYMGWVPRDRLKEYLDGVKSSVEVSISGRVQHPGLLDSPKLEPIGEIEGHPKWRSPHIGGIIKHLSGTIPGLDPDVFVRSGEQATGKTIKLEEIPIDGYRHPLRLPPAKHIEYAVTWYGVAVALISVWIALSFRREDEVEVCADEGGQEDDGESGDGEGRA